MPVHSYVHYVHETLRWLSTKHIRRPSLRVASPPPHLTAPSIAAQKHCIVMSVVDQIERSVRCVGLPVCLCVNNNFRKK